MLPCWTRYVLRSKAALDKMGQTLPEIEKHEQLRERKRMQERELEWRVDQMEIEREVAGGHANERKREREGE
eukprot:5238329-Pleurochrysis_carterae.AAC.1